MSTSRPARLQRVQCTARRALLIFLPLLLLVFAGAWVTTYRTLASVDYRFGSYIAPGTPGGETSWWTYRARTLGASSFHGRVALRFSEYRSLAPTREELLGWSSHAGWTWLLVDGVSPLPSPLAHWTSATDFDVLGLGLTRDNRQGEDSRAICLPYWFLSLAAAGLWLVLWLPRRRRSLRRSRGQCPACGYDRAGLVEGDPCPECGMELRTP